jgi:hypothetical protein
VGCDQVIQQVGPPDGRLVLGVLAAPPANLEHAAPTGTRPWAYFAKYGIAIRADSPVVLITVPEAWRHRAAVGWGNDIGGVSSLRLLSCPPQAGAWNAYAGGFYLRSASGCVPLVFEIGRETATLRFAIGSGTCGTTNSVSVLARCPTSTQIIAAGHVLSHRLPRSVRDIWPSQARRSPVSTSPKDPGSTFYWRAG